MNSKSKVEKRIKEIKRNTRRKYNSEEKIRIVLEGLRGESSIAELCRKEGITRIPTDLPPLIGQYYATTRQDLAKSLPI